MSQHEAGMSGRDWLKMLGNDSIEQQINGLRQIAGNERVTDVAVKVAELAGSSDDEVRQWAAEALENSVIATAADVPDLIRLLQSSRDGEVVYWTATLLGRVGHPAAEAVSALERCLNESMYLPARERAAWALRQIGPAASPAMPTLRRLAVEGPPRLKRLAIQALEAIRGVAA